MQYVITLFCFLLGGIWIASGIVRGIIRYLSHVNGVFRILFFIVSYLSGGFHELCHLLGFYVCWIPLSLSQYRISMTELVVNVNSRVYARISFLKALIIIFCPLLMVTFTVMAILLYSPFSSPLVQGIIWGVVGVIGLQCAPSNQDWRVVMHVIQLKPWSSLRQIGEIIVSLVIGYVWTLDWWSSSIFLGAELIWNGGTIIIALVQKSHRSRSRDVRPQSVPIRAIFPSQKVISPKLPRRLFKQPTPKLFKDIAQSRKQMDKVAAQFSWDDLGI